MIFNEFQEKILSQMTSDIQNFRNGELSYFDLVYNLEGSLDTGEFKDENFTYQWYDFWTPLEILYATKGNNVTFQEADIYLKNMESFLKSISFDK